MVTHKEEQWLQYNNLTHLNENWTLFANTGARWKDGFEEFAILFGRAGAAYSVSEKIGVAAGFTYVEFYADKEQYLVELRPYEEVLIRDTGAHTLKLNQRFRFEQRFYNPVVDGKIQSDNTFALRFRYALMTGITLFRLSKDNPDAKFRLNISDEIMFNAGKNIIYNVFDKNRFIISPAVQLNKWITIAVAWNNQFAASSSEAGHYIYTNALWVNLTHTINLSKKKLGDINGKFPVIPATNSNL
ncbi:DUF2490 domain-containing protein [Flagellimonas iocasae]|uniref:DUF2490 domain-containing protein n=1 Tax=Flagellimonas iocasae TaxID=2055905 RepID=A0ABW4XV60_9FLAO